MSIDLKLKETVPHATTPGVGSSRAHHGRCHHCNDTLPQGEELHENCREEYEWEQRMKKFNPLWHPSRDIGSEENN